MNDGALPVVVRGAHEADRDAIVEMCTSSMRATYGAIFTEEQMAPWIEGGATGAYVGSMLAKMLVAEHDGRIVGVVAIDGDLIDLVWVGLGARGRGVGTRLMAAAERAIRGAGHDTARLEVFVGNDDAIGFYERRGLVRTGRYPDPQAGIDKIVMAKRLG